MAANTPRITLMIHKNYFIIFLLLSGFIFQADILAKNEIYNTSSSNDQLQSELTELEGDFENRIQHVEDTFKKFSDEYRLAIMDFKKDVGTTGSIIQISSFMIAVLTLLIAILTAIAVIALPRYFIMMDALKQTEKKSKIQQQLDSLMARIELGVTQQALERFYSIMIEDEPIDSTRSVMTAHTRALQIRGILEEMRSGGKDVNVEELCRVLQQLSDIDTEKTWTKDVREYLYLLLSGEFLNDDSAKQAVKNLFRNL
jgi:hypothetical protein